MRIEITAVPSVSDGTGNRYRTGQVVTVDDDLARAWVAAGHARESGKTAAKRTATRRAPRTASAKPKPSGTGGAPPAEPDAGTSE
ncbi:hypothetical protein [Streptomyces sp. NPDC050164]|uniref:hypothetical protein n=1 Tax=Streptomyces sp. NPDC050164 TaxID=3365605 RepID=UPI0037A7D609